MARQRNFLRRLPNFRLLFVSWWLPLTGWWRRPARWLNTNWRATLKRVMLLSLLLAALAGISYLFYNIFAFGWPIKSGFDEFIPPQPKSEGYERAKTLWDWMQLLVVPFVLAVAAFVLNRTERISAEKAVEQRTKAEREIAERRTQDEVLDTYLDHMAELLIDKQLLKSQPSDEVRTIARIKTLAALRRLDGDRNRILLQFLYEADLLKKGSFPGASVIDLRRADLYRVNLQGNFLGGVNLQSANLREANLKGISLQGAFLGGANLEEANLEGAFLSGTNFLGANMRKTDLREAFLGGSNLQGADLSGARLQMSMLAGANLQDANLLEADLKGVDLTGANLEGATMPDGSKHE